MNILLCDDDRNFTEQLEREIRSYAAFRDISVQIAGWHAPEALLTADLSEYHAVFLDIEMPQVNGLDLARELRIHYPEMLLVFVTGWIQYAPDGYRVNAFRYLLKSRLQDELWPCLDDIRQKLQEDRALVSMPTKEGAVEVFVRNIGYLEGTSHRMAILHFTTQTEPLECVGRLDDFERSLEEKGFLRIQRSYLVNMAHIVKIRNYQAVLQDGTELKVSERQYASVCRRFLLWKGRTL